MSEIAVRIDGADVLFSGWRNERLLIEMLESAFGTNAEKAKLLVFVKRIEFVIEGEVVPLFIDDDESAHIEVRKNSNIVKEKVMERIRRSPDFLVA